MNLVQCSAAKMHGIELTSPHSSLMYKKTSHVQPFELRLRSNPIAPLHLGKKKHPHSSSLNLVFLSSSLPIAPLNSRFSKACCLTWQEREKGRTNGRADWKRKEKRGRKEEKEGGLIVQFNYQPWLVSALVGNYTTQLQETAPLHPIRVGTEGCAAACFLSLSYNPSLLLGLPFYFSFSLLFFFFKYLPPSPPHSHFYQLTLFNRHVEYIK